MEHALKIDFRGLEQPSPHTSKASVLREIAHSLNKAAAKVEARWAELPSEERKAYEHLAYVAIEGRYQDLGKMRATLSRSYAALNLFLITLRGEQEAFIEYVLAFRRFAYVILDAIEREQHDYQVTLADILNEGLPEEVGESMTTEEARERLRKLRYQVLD